MPKYEAVLLKSYNYASKPIIIEADSLSEAEAMADEMWVDDPFSIDWEEPEVEYLGPDLYKLEDE